MNFKGLDLCIKEKMKIHFDNTIRPPCSFETNLKIRNGIRSNKILDGNISESAKVFRFYKMDFLRYRAQLICIHRDHQEEPHPSSFYHPKFDLDFE